MARIIGRLTAKFAANAKPKGKPSPSGRHCTRYCDGGGLHLVCTAGTDGLINRSWSFKYESGGGAGRKGRRHEVGLGPLFDVSLAKAREKAAALREMLREGIDPLHERRARQRALAVERARSVTFKQDAEAFMALHEKGWSPKHAQQWWKSLEQHVFPAIGNTPVAEIIPATLLRIIEPLWLKRTVTAARIVNRLENVLAYATTHDHRQGDNPASNLLAALPKQSKVAPVENFASVPFQEVPGIVARLREIGTPAALALIFLILTAARAGEVIGCEWTEIDLAKATWTIPARRMKGRREHRNPLSAPAVRLLQGLPRKDKQCFPITLHSMLRVLRKVSADVTVHGMRSSFKRWAVERTSFAPSVSEAALAHKLAGNPTEGAYLRPDVDLFEKRRRLMEQWAAFCTKPAAKIAGSTVVPMQGKVSADA
jgi:integrase